MAGRGEASAHLENGIVEGGKPRRLLTLCHTAQQHLHEPIIAWRLLLLEVRSLLLAARLEPDDLRTIPGALPLVVVAAALGCTLGCTVAAALGCTLGCAVGCAAVALCCALRALALDSARPLRRQRGHVCAFA